MQIRSSLLHPDLLQALETQAVVLVPNRRVAHAISRSFARHNVDAGKRAWATPQVYTLQAWLERLWLLRGRSSPSLVLLNPIQTRRAWQGLVESSPWASRLLAPQNAAFTALRSYELARAWQIPLAEITVFDSAEAQALIAWINSFDELCSSHAWLPHYALLEELLEGDGVPAASLVLVGFEELNPQERMLFAHIQRGGGKVTQIPRASPAQKIVVAPASDARNELLQAALWARAHLESGAGTIGVVVANLDQTAALVRRIFEDVFSPELRTLTAESLVPAFTLASASPLANYPITRTALDILELATGHAPSTLAGLLLRSPFVVGADDEASARALADVRLRKEGRELFDLGALERLADASSCPVFGVSLREARLLVTNPVPRLPSQWADLFVALWRAVGWPGDRTLSSEEQQTAAKLHEALGVFGSLNLLLGAITFRRATQEFAQLVKQTQFEPRTPASPVSIVDRDSVAGMQFDALWVAGMDANQWPPPAEPDTFIPTALQVRAGVPEATSAGMQRKFHERYLGLSSAAPEVVFSWAQMQEDVQQDPSPWIAGLPVRESSPSKNKIGYRHTLFAGRVALEEITELTAPPLRNRRLRGGTRIAELAALCPFRSQAELRLHAQPLQQVGAGIDALERGHLMHAALSELWTRLGSHAALIDLTVEQRRAMTREILGRLSAPLLIGASDHRARLVAIELSVAETKILELLELEAQRMPFAVYRQPELDAAYRIGGLDLQVRFDRIDELADGRRVVIDYKTGGSASAAKWWGDRPEQPQLPLYAVLEGDSLAAVAFAQLGAGKVGFEGVAREANLLPGLSAYPGRRAAPPERADWTRLIPYWRTVIEQLFAGFASGRVDVDPLPQACRYCHLSTLCRIHEIGLSREPVDNG